MYYNREGDKITLQEWSDLVSNHEYKILKRSTLKDGKLVSTVWLGINHAFDAGKPLIFETMVFPAEKEWSELAVARYSTESEALAGHESMVKEYSK